MAPLPPRDLDHVLESTRGLWKSLSGSRLFITGASGFVGTWLMETLLHANDRLNLGISAAVLTRDPERYFQTNPPVTHHPAVTVLGGDVRTFEFPSGEFPYVIHAGLPDPQQPEADAAGMLHILEFAATHGARRFLFTSSGAVYGKQPPEVSQVPENFRFASDVTPYGLAKRVSESLLIEHGREFGFAPILARLFAFTGPRLPLDQNFAVGNFIRDVLAGQPIRIEGDGTPYRSYLYAADMAVWLWTMLAHGTPFAPYNVGSGEAVSIAELAGMVAAATAPGTPIEIAQQPVSGAPAPRYVPCVERAKVELGLEPVIALEEGVRRMYEWAKQPA